MHIFIHTSFENKNHRSFFIEKLKQAGNTIFEIETCMDFKKEINENKNIPDLALLDFYSYNALHFDLFEHLKKQQQQIPVFIYNYPIPENCSIELFWRMTYGTLNLKYFEDEKYRYIFDILMQLFNLFRQQQSKNQLSAPKEINKEIQEFSDILTVTQQKLFNILLENQNSIISLEKLQDKLCENGLIWKKNTLNCHISRLHLKLQSNPQTKLQLIKTGSGYTLSSL